MPSALQLPAAPALGAAPAAVRQKQALFRWSKEIERKAQGAAVLCLLAAVILGTDGAAVRYCMSPMLMCTLYE